MSVVTRMTDLKLLDELLCDFKTATSRSWEEVEQYSSVTREAMQRLRDAWLADELPVVTLSLARYFRDGP